MWVFDQGLGFYKVIVYVSVFVRFQVSTRAVYLPIPSCVGHDLAHVSRCKSFGCYAARRSHAHTARDAQPAGAAARGGSLCVRRCRKNGTPATRHKRQGEQRSELSARTTTPTCGDGLHAVKNRAAGGEGGPRARQREPSDHPPW